MMWQWWDWWWRSRQTAKTQLSLQVTTTAEMAREGAHLELAVSTTAAASVNYKATAQLALNATPWASSPGQMKIGPNLVVNPGNENTRIGRYSTGAYSTEQKHSGSRSFKVTTTGATNAVTLAPVDSRNAPTRAYEYHVRAGDKFYLEAWVYAHANNTAGGEVTLQAAMRDTSGAVATTTITADSADMGIAEGFPYEFPIVFGDAHDFTPAVWIKLAGYVKVPLNCDRMAVTVQTGTSTPSGNIYYYDDFVVNEVTTSHLVDFDANLYEQCEQIWELTRATVKAEDDLRKQEPMIRLWDADWNLMFVCSVEYRATFSWISNDTGPGQIQIPMDTKVAQWIIDFDGRVKRGAAGAPFDVHRNVHVTVDYCGARWSGRLDKCAVEQRQDGDHVLVADFLHDYENLKWYSVWPNPFLPAIFQFPRAFLLAGPCDWVLKLALFLQLFREHNPLITWPDDPLDLTQWFTDLDTYNWNVVIAPNGFMQSMASGITWGIISSRMSNWHDMAHQMLEDAELSVDCRRWLNGDPLPWKGARMRHGQLIVDIIDKSGVFVGTANGGSIFDGLIRTIVEFADDFIDSTTELIVDSSTTVPVDYFRWGHKYTDKAMPYVVYIQGDNSPIQTSAFIVSPTKSVQVTTGGHSFPGVNEVISATIQAGFDILGTLIFMGGLGGVIDTLVKPLYEDVILAWWSVKSPMRAQHSGWSRYFEYFQESGGKAYTIASLFVLRAGFWATRNVVSWKVEVWDGRPFLVGDRGLGHFFLDDRVGLVLAGDNTQSIHMDRCRKLDLSWEEEKPVEWSINIGDDRILQDPAQRAWGKIESMIAALKDIGVW